jgi:hypothetical protein
MQPIGENFWDLVIDLDVSASPHSHPFCLGKLLEKTLRRSLVWKKSQREVAALMSGAFDPKVVDKWREMRELFDLDQTNPNPYEEVDNRTSIFYNVSICADEGPDVTLAQLKLELLKEDAKQLAGGTPTNKVSAGTFIRKAIEIEDRR